MKNLRDLVKELEANKSLNEMLDVLKIIAMEDFKELEKQKKRFDLFLERYEEFFGVIDFSRLDHPFADLSGTLGIVAVTSDEGFMGGLNARVLNKCFSFAETEPVKFIVMGKKGADRIRDTDHDYDFYPGIAADDRYESALKLKDLLMEKSVAGEFSRLKIVYPRPVSFISQEIEVLSLLPLPPDFFKKREAVIADTQKVIVESTGGKIIEYLAEVWITQKLFEVFEESKLSEFSARAVRLEESHQTVLEQEKKLKAQYFRSRREAIDKSMQDIFGGRIVRGGKQGGGNA